MMQPTPPLPTLHPLLLRQLKRLGLDAAAATPAAEPHAGLHPELLQRVSRAYESYEQDQQLLEHSEALASQEMQALYASLRLERDTLEARVHERTAELQRSEARLSSLVSLSADWVWETDAALRLTYLSDSYAAATGRNGVRLLGRDMRLITQHGSEAELAAYMALIEARVAFRDLILSETDSQQRTQFLRISGEPAFAADGRFVGWRGIGSNVTQARQTQQQVQELARLDSLTRLPNRNLFLAELEASIVRARADGGRFALCCIDLDRFKVVNDTLGHGAGDALLQAVAGRLRRVVRHNDMLARLGGDEFVVVLDQLAPDADTAGLAGKLLQALSEPVEIEGRSVVVTGSIGIAHFPGDGDSASTLLRHADSAMHLAKDKGKNNVQVFTSELAEQAARKLGLESELRLALVRNELRLFYQPKIDMASGRMDSVEALIRWVHPRRGLVPPGDFIALAEESDLIVLIGRWVIREACRQLAAWRSAGLATPKVAINLSGRQFADDGLVGDITSALRSNGLEAGCLEVELTESVLMHEPERAERVLAELGALGVQVAIDDFGTGYSSLSYLKRFPAQTVKIDRAFVSGLPHDRDDAAITQAIIAMAHTLGLVVVAEGVETDAQMQALRGMGCDEVQGFLLGRPMTADHMQQRIGHGGGAAAGPSATAAVAGLAAAQVPA